MENSLSGLSVIVIENEPIVALGLENACRKALASDVSATGSLIEANQILRDRHLDIAIDDIRLREGEAWPLIDELTQMGIPMVVHSGHLDTGNRCDLPKAVYLAKPAHPRELRQALLTAYASVAPKGVGDATVH